MQREQFNSFCILAALLVSAPLTVHAQDHNPPGKGQQGGTPAQGKPAQGKPAQDNPVQDGRQGAGQDQRPGTMTDRSRLQLRPGDEFMGMGLGQKTGDQVGSVRDMVIRPDGSIAYLVVDSPSAKSGDSYYPIPWQQVQYDTLQPSNSAGAGQAVTNGEGRLVARFEGNRLAGAPSFERSRWPTDNEPFTESDRYFGGGKDAGGQGRAGERGTDMEKGITPAGAMKQANVRASEFRDRAVTDASGTVIGKTGRVAIDPVQGRINYVTVSLTNVPGASGRTIAVPWSALKATKDGEKNGMQLSIPADQLQNAPQYKSGTDDWDEMSDPNWIRSMYAFYKVDPYWDSTGTMRDGRDGRDDGSRERTDGTDDRGSKDRPIDRKDPKEKKPGQTPPQ